MKPKNPENVVILFTDIARKAPNDLSEIVKDILGNTMIWIEAGRRESSPGWLRANFASVFLHNCQLVRKNPRFEKWGNCKFLKARWLSHDFDGEHLGRIRFNVTGLDVHNEGAVYDLNCELQECLSHRRYQDTLAYKQAYSRLQQEKEEFPQVNNGKLFDLSKIENFKF